MRLKSQLKELSFRSFLALDRVGIHVLPKHYYTPVPDQRWLRANRDAWMGRVSLTGVHWNLDEQMAWLAGVCKPYYHEVKGLDFFRSAQGYGPGFGAIESQVLHCAIRSLRPPRIVEVGSGASTAHMLRAIERNKSEGGIDSQITCIEPFPKPKFRNISNVDHVEEMVQRVSPSVFSQLEAGDLLFIDSSHSVKVGSDVVKLYLDIIPKLPQGVYVHVHDVFLPYVYPRTVLHEYFGWQESALLLALLTENPKLSVRCSLSALHYDCPQELSTLLEDYLPQQNDEGLSVTDEPDRYFPSSLWMQTV